MSKRKQEEKEEPNKKQKLSKSLKDYFEIPNYKTEKEYTTHFIEFSDFLLNQTVLTISDTQFRFTELEFYYTNETHFDPFTHKSDLQQQSGKWYFHTMPNGSFKGGSFKGLDITIGNKDAYGGILIRGIQNLETKRIIDGPSLCVDTILSLNNSEKVDTLAKILKDKHELSVINEESHLNIKESTNLSPLKVHKSARVGLTLKQKDHKEKRLEYLLKFYRFFSFPQDIKKGKNYMVIAAYHLGDSVSDIVKTFRAQKKSVENFIELYKKGGDVEKYFGAKLTNDDLAILHGALKEHL
eukprot:gene9453-1659_t